MKKRRIVLLGTLLFVVGFLGLHKSTSQAVTCTAPTYACANTSVDVLQVGATPDMGTALGANIVGTDPAFGTTVIRATDSVSCRGGFSLLAGIGGSATVNT